MDGQPTWTDCDEAGDYVVPNVLSPRDLVSRPDNMDENVPHTLFPLSFLHSLLFLLSHPSFPVFPMAFNNITPAQEIKCEESCFFHDCLLYMSVGWLIDSTRPGKQFFSHVGMELPLPGY